MATRVDINVALSILYRGNINHDLDATPMVSDAITSLKERTGSSVIAIGKFIEDKHKTHLPSNFKKLLSSQLKKLTVSGKLVKVKNSSKLASAAPKPVSTKMWLNKMCL